ISASHIANRTRTFLVQALAGEFAERTNHGVHVVTSSPNRLAIAAFAVPSDFVSNLRVSPLFYVEADAEITGTLTCRYGGNNEALNAHTDTGTTVELSISAGRRRLGTAAALNSAAIG